MSQNFVFKFTTFFSDCLHFFNYSFRYFNMIENYLINKKLKKHYLVSKYIFVQANKQFLIADYWS